MKQSLSLIILSLIFFQSGAQEMGPTTNTFDSSLIKNEEYTFTWYMFQDTLRHEIGRVTTKIIEKGGETTFITDVKMPNATMPWIDSTVVKTKDFAPVYHVSQNRNRDMAMHYGKGVTGFYLDNKTGKRIELDENPTGSYFDSSSYPHLIRWMPLKEGYQETISIFDFNPNAKIGKLTVTIKDVSSVQLKVTNGTIDAWKVYVTDDISDNQVNNYYFIDKETHELIKQEIEVQGRKMVMERTNL